MCVDDTRCGLDVCASVVLVLMVMVEVCWCDVAVCSSATSGVSSTSACSSGGKGYNVERRAIEA